MKIKIIACSMLRQELSQAMKDTGCSYPITWLDAGLHNFPDKLRCELQSALNQITEADCVLLCSGFCGNSVAGIQAGDFEVILPRADDCLTLLIGSQLRRQEVSKGTGTYFLTQAWLSGDQNLLNQYQHTIKRYGNKRARRVFDIMFGNYQQIALLDTGCYSLAEAEPKAQQIASTLGLNYCVIPASNKRLRELLTGPWSEEWFLRLKPHEVLDWERLSSERVP